ncbi:RimK family alpha-L-glutamate ligase [Flavobacterium sp. H122]|uniref:ATP-grasp domain-containing protein n=1 Tax=Flavobacterium sp. H122 TaxID=2529860 RepID=UPI0010AAD93B|nr:hypothetical protein [Flavobacterium sp. H122]
MKFINRLISKIFAFLYLFIRISFLKWFKNYDKNADTIVWIKTNPITTLLRYLKHNDLLSDFALIEAIAQKDIPFKIVVGSNIGKYINKRVFYNVSENCNPYKLANYSATLYHTVKMIESQGNIVFPKTSEVEYWENKAFMQEQFTKLEISHPKTIILNRNYQPSELSKIEYPALIKEIHSAGSRGITKVNSEAELLVNLGKVWKKGHSKTIVQKLVDMRRDLRVVILNDEVISFYWRVNSTDEWKPTATSFGNSTVFGGFPEQWRELFVDYMKQMEMTTGAFDITWEKDNLNTLPLILEVSPSYQLNPPLPERYKSIPYKDYKKKLFIAEAYYKTYVDIVFELKKKITDNYFKKFSL